MKRSLIVPVFCFALLSFGYGQNYSIKNRLNTRVSVSFNQTNQLFRHYQWLEPIRTTFQSRANMRADCNYGVLNWLEVGGYIGYIRYENALKGFYFHYNKPENIYKELPLDFAPTFGINANVHLLPFLKVKKNCRWEWYLTAKYGGAYLIGHVPYHSSAIIFDGKTGYRKEIDFGEARYRHEFGIGMGSGVYFWKGLGVYAEALFGQYSYFPEVFSHYYTVRVGFEYKFTLKKKKNRETGTQPQHIEIE